MKYKLTHKTEYKYAEPVNNYHSLLCLAPRILPRQLCNGFKISVEPAPSQIIEHIDFYGNTTHYFSIHTPHKKLTVLATSMVERIPEAPAGPRPGNTCEE